MQNPRLDDNITADFLETNCVYPIYDQFLAAIDRAMTCTGEGRSDAFEEAMIVHLHFSAAALKTGFDCDLFVASDYERIMRLSDGREGDHTKLLKDWDKDESLTAALGVMTKDLHEVCDHLRSRYQRGNAAEQERLAKRISGLAQVASFVHCLDYFASETSRQAPACKAG